MIYWEFLPAPPEEGQQPEYASTDPAHAYAHGSGPIGAAYRKTGIGTDWVPVFSLAAVIDMSAALQRLEAAGAGMPAPRKGWVAVENGEKWRREGLFAAAVRGAAPELADGIPPGGLVLTYSARALRER